MVGLVDVLGLRGESWEVSLVPMRHCCLQERCNGPWAATHLCTINVLEPPRVAPSKG